jgi:hypothetical protein
MARVEREKPIVAPEMPWDCDKYFSFDREKDRALWPISPALHAPVSALAFAVVAVIVWLVA